MRCIWQPVARISAKGIDGKSICGVTGFRGLGGQADYALHDLARRMAATLRQRGPNDGGTWADGGLAGVAPAWRDHSDSENLLADIAALSLRPTCNAMWAGSSWLSTIVPNIQGQGMAALLQTVEALLDTMATKIINNLQTKRGDSGIGGGCPVCLAQYPCPCAIHA